MIKKVRYIPHPDDQLYIETNLPKEFQEVTLTLEMDPESESFKNLIKVQEQFTVKDKILQTVEGYVQVHPVYGNVMRAFLGSDYRG